MHSGERANPHDDRSLRVFWIGERIHEALQGSFPFEVVGHELPVRDEEFKLSGRIDTLAKVDGVLEVAEFKSVNSKKFSYGGLPEEHHILQLGCYLTFPARKKCPSNMIHYNENEEFFLTLPIEGVDVVCSECNNTGIQTLTPQRGRLIYWSKDDARIEEYVIYPSEELANAVKGELVRLESLYQAYRSTGNLPAPLPPTIRTVRGKKVETEDWRVRYCAYRGTGKCCGDEARSGDENDVGYDNTPQGKGM